MNFNFILASSTGYDMGHQANLQNEPVIAYESLGSEYWF